MAMDRAHPLKVAPVEPWRPSRELMRGLKPRKW